MEERDILQSPQIKWFELLKFNPMVLKIWAPKSYNNFLSYDQISRAQIPWSADFKERDLEMISFWIGIQWHVVFNEPSEFPWILIMAYPNHANGFAWLILNQVSIRFCFENVHVGFWTVMMMMQSEGCSRSTWTCWMVW